MGVDAGREVASALSACVKQAHLREIRQCQGVTGLGAHARDIAERISTNITKLFGIGRGADTEGIQYENDCSGHNFFVSL
jgi:hypothetical protein